MPPEEYKAEIQRCAAKWKLESPEAKKAYESKAAYEQCLRNEAMKQPLSSKISVDDGQDLGNAAFDAASELRPKALKRISKPRLVETFRRFMDSDMWGQVAMGLASSDGCLRLDLIDVQTPLHDVARHMSVNFHGPAPLEGNLEEAIPGCHDETCWEMWGHCARKPHAELAKKFVRTFKHFCTQGILALLNFMSVAVASLH